MHNIFQKEVRNYGHDQKGGYTDVEGLSEVQIGSFVVFRAVGLGPHDSLVLQRSKHDRLEEDAYVRVKVACGGH